MNQTLCNESCPYYIPINSFSGDCLFKYSHPIPLREVNSICNLEDYLNIPEKWCNE